MYDDDEFRLLYGQPTLLLCLKISRQTVQIIRGRTLDIAITVTEVDWSTSPWDGFKPYQINKCLFVNPVLCITPAHQAKTQVQDTVHARFQDQWLPYLMV